MRALEHDSLYTFMHNLLWGWLGDRAHSEHGSGHQLNGEDTDDVSEHTLSNSEHLVLLRLHDQLEMKGEQCDMKRCCQKQSKGYITNRNGTKEGGDHDREGTRDSEELETVHGRQRSHDQFVVHLGESFTKITNRYQKSKDERWHEMNCRSHADEGRHQMTS